MGRHRRTSHQKWDQPSLQPRNLRPPGSCAARYLQLMAAFAVGPPPTPTLVDERSSCGISLPVNLKSVGRAQLQQPELRLATQMLKAVLAEGDLRKAAPAAKLMMSSAKKTSVGSHGAEVTITATTAMCSLVRCRRRARVAIDNSKLLPTDVNANSGWQPLQQPPRPPRLMAMAGPRPPRLMAMAGPRRLTAMTIGELPRWPTRGIQNPPAGMKAAVTKNGMKAELRHPAAEARVAKAQRAAEATRALLVAEAKAAEPLLQR